MPEGGKLTIGLQKAQDGTAQVVFEDTGVGMTPEEQEQMFQPFQSGFVGGIGLGLSVVFQIIEDHRGKISVESEKGKGTKVSLCFPLETGAPATELLELALQG
jgi:signal transduction histidine kinase